MQLSLLLLLSPGGDGFGVYSPRPLRDNQTMVDDAALGSVYRWPARRTLLRYAISPDLCAALQPRLIEGASWTSWIPFAEVNFTRCERLHQSIQDAFATWQRASPTVSFVEVTGRCRAERMWTPVPEEHCVLSPLCSKLENSTPGSASYVDWTVGQTPLEDAQPSSDTCTHRTCWDCARADVVVGAFSQKNRRLGDQHARTRVVRRRQTDMRPVGTDGAAQPGGLLGRSLLQFNADHAYSENGAAEEACWLLDTQACDWVAAAGGDASVESPLTLGFALLLALAICCCCCSVCVCLRQLAYNLLAGYDMDGDGKLSFSEYAYVLDEFIGCAPRARSQTPAVHLPLPMGRGRTWGGGAHALMPTHPLLVLALVCRHHPLPVGSPAAHP